MFLKFIPYLCPKVPPCYVCMQPTKKIIAIIAGGDSSEHDVSMRSAQGIDSWIDRTCFIPYTIETRGLDWQALLPDGGKAPVCLHDFSFEDNGQRVRPDFAFIIIHGTPGEDGKLQGYFDLQGVPYSSCNVLVCALTFNKFMLNQFLAHFGVRTAQSILLRKGDTATAEQIVEAVGLPCFIKPNASGSSFGVTKCKTLEDIAPAIALARTEGEDVMIEALLDGTEIACGVFQTKRQGIRALPITEVVPKDEFFDYDAKYNGRVEEITPARLSTDTTRRVQQLTEHIYRLLGASGIIRVDYILTEGDVINLLEINAIPGMTATSFIPQQARAAGIDMTELISEIINDKL